VAGKPVVIDDSFEHEMINDGDEPVLWLSVDFPHPDLPFGAEKKTSLSEYAKRFFLTI
jgi:aspartyl/asparaginyl beta-hydroxylase (cupin superfamily)